MSEETPNEPTTYALDPAGPAPMSEVVLDVTAAPVAGDDQPPPKPGRARGGLFAKGNRIARGNAKTRLASRWRNAVLDSISVDELTAIVTGVKQRALAGDMRAATAILRFIASDAMPKAGKAARSKAAAKPAT